MSSTAVAAARARLEQRKAELADRQQRAQRDASHGQDPLVADFADQAIQVQNDAVLDEIDAAAGAEIAEIDLALAQIDAGRYGICRHCHTPINPRRLAAVPQAVICAPCALAEIALARP